MKRRPYAHPRAPPPHVLIACGCSFYGGTVATVVQVGVSCITGTDAVPDPAVATEAALIAREWARVNLKFLNRAPFFKMAQNLDLRCVLVPAPWVLGRLLGLKHVSNPECKVYATLHLQGALAAARKKQWRCGVNFLLHLQGAIAAARKRLVLATWFPSSDSTDLEGAGTSNAAAEGVTVAHAAPLDDAEEGWEGCVILPGVPLPFQADAFEPVYVLADQMARHSHLDLKASPHMFCKVLS